MDQYEDSELEHIESMSVVEYRYHSNSTVIEEQQWLDAEMERRRDGMSIFEQQRLAKLAGDHEGIERYLNWLARPSRIE